MAEAIERVRDEMIASKVTFNQMGTNKRLTDEQKIRAAEPFGAESKRMSAAKKIIDTRNSAVRGVTAVLSRVQQYWKSITLPYPDPGVRLIKRNDVQKFEETMRGFQTELEAAVDVLAVAYQGLKQDAQEKLGQLYREDDYPTTVRGLYAIEWSFPAITPDERLQQISPEMYRRECEKIQNRFQQAVDMAETAFMEEFSSMVAHLSEKLTGEGKVFRNTAVTNLTEFFDRFKHLNVNSNAALDQLIEDAKSVVQGVAPQDLRENQTLRSQFAQQMQGVQNRLETLLVDRPRRTVRRPGAAPAVTAADDSEDETAQTPNTSAEAA